MQDRFDIIQSMDKTIDGRPFIWDDEKSRINFQKHGIKFETAAKVFRDEFKIIQEDFLHSTTYEERMKVIGMVNDVLCVIYTERRRATRLISARKANLVERGQYYGNRDLLLAQRSEIDSGGDSGTGSSEGF